MGGDGGIETYCGVLMRAMDSILSLSEFSVRAN